MAEEALFTRRSYRNIAQKCCFKKIEFLFDVSAIPQSVNILLIVENNLFQIEKVIESSFLAPIMGRKMYVKMYK